MLSLDVLPTITLLNILYVLLLTVSLPSSTYALTLPQSSPLPLSLPQNTTSTNATLPLADPDTKTLTIKPLPGPQPGRFIAHNSLLGALISVSLTLTYEHPGAHLDESIYSTLTPGPLGPEPPYSWSNLFPPQTYGSARVSASGFRQGMPRYAT